MKSKQISQALEIAYATRRPTMLWGPPGVGKSSIVKALAARLGVPLLDWRLTLMDPVDMRGTPRERNGRTYWAPPAELPDASDSSGGIIFLDELAQARMETKNVAAMLVLENRIGEYELPKSWRIMAASNRLTDSSGTSPMPMHLNNRFWHLEFEVSATEWLEWGDCAGIDPRVLAFIKYRDEALLEFDPRSKDAAFATPRSWVALAEKLAAMDAAGITQSMGHEPMTEWFSGEVGKRRGTEFAGFLRTMHALVSIEEVFAAPAKAPLATDPSIAYALVYALASHADRKTIDAAHEYVKRLPREFSVVFMRAIEQRAPAMKKSKAYVELCAANSEAV